MPDETQVQSAPVGQSPMPKVGPGSPADRVAGGRMTPETQAVEEPEDRP